MEDVERRHQIGGVDVVADLLAAVAEHRVRLAGHRAAHEVGQEAVKLRPGMVGPGEATPPEAHGRHAEIAAVFLDEQVGGRLGHAEQRMGRAIDRHRRIDTAKVAVILGHLQPVLELDQRQVVGQVAVDLVRRAEDEGGRRGVAPRRLEQHRGAVGVHGEVGLADRRRPSRARAGRRCGSLARSSLDARANSRSTASASRMSYSNERNESPSVRTSRSVVVAVEAEGPKNCARMSFSIPMTS